MLMFIIAALFTNDNNTNLSFFFFFVFKITVETKNTLIITHPHYHKIPANDTIPSPNQAVQPPRPHPMQVEDPL